MIRVHDAADVMPFLLSRSTVAMFPIVNLRDHGIDGDHPRSMSVWAVKTNGKITDVLCRTNAGIVLPVFTTDCVDQARDALTRTPIAGIIGQADQVAAMHNVLQLKTGDLHRVEPHFELELNALQQPETAGMSLVPADQIDRDLLIAWRTQYGIDALDMASDAAAKQAAKDVANMIQKGQHRVLLHNQTPVAMTGFNSVVDDTVMIGGVYTPSALRGRGFARAAVSMHLAQARETGIKTAVLSAANVAAAAAYIAIGFQQVGQFMIILFDKPQVIHG